MEAAAWAGRRLLLRTALAAAGLGAALALPAVAAASTGR